MALTDNMRGALLMAGAMTAFTVNDAFMKALSDELPLFQALFIRGLGVISVLAVAVGLKGRGVWRLPRRDWVLVLVRTASEIAAAYFFLTALFNMPIANVTAILQALPLTVTLAGALFLGEAVGWRRLLAIMVGFAGVLLIVKPGGEGFNFYSVFVLLAVLCVTVRDLTARQMSRQVPSLLIALVAAMGVTGFAGLMLLLTEARPVGQLAAFQLLGATFFVLFGYVCSVAAMRVGEIGVVAQFRYVSLVVALILGLAVFGDWPVWSTLVGAGLIVATGIFTLARERRLRLVRETPVPLRVR